ncbi:hypothetical protein H9P43_009788 [Blastocladiella emersonii ATCC 22665]|nr:hypothetical protein H9P43_009788 [Blastocladiella emersonii ATCC 22665]
MTAELLAFAQLYGFPINAAESSADNDDKFLYLVEGNVAIARDSMLKPFLASLEIQVGSIVHEFRSLRVTRLPGVDEARVAAYAALYAAANRYVPTPKSGVVIQKRAILPVVSATEDAESIQLVLSLPHDKLRAEIKARAVTSSKAILGTLDLFVGGLPQSYRLSCPISPRFMPCFIKFLKDGILSAPTKIKLNEGGFNPKTFELMKSGFYRCFLLPTYSANGTEYNWEHDEEFDFGVADERLVELN